MKQLKSRSEDLRRLFESNITAEYIAEPLQAIAAEISVTEALQWMEARDFDVAGVKSGEAVCGYVERSRLTSLLEQSDFCSKHQQIFHPRELIAVSTPLMQLLPLLRQTPRLFVLTGNEVTGILTCGDLQKAPVRMLLFGMATLLEMNLLRLIRLNYQEDTWQSHLKPDRLEAAKRLWKESQSRNEATDLLDYLQFCDKRDLILSHANLLQRLGLPSRRSGDRFLKSAEQLRNRLAHAQNLVNGSSWPELIDLAEGIEALLRRSEEII